MPDTRHVLIPWAYLATPGCDHALASIRLPHLQRLLARCAPQQAFTLDDNSHALPHERVQAQLLGLDTEDGMTPWAAWYRHQAGHADAAGHGWAFITPCLWQVGADSVRMDDPRHLRLDAASSQALLDILAPWFSEDGIELHYDRPDRWLARSTLFEGLRTASLDRVLHRDVRYWMSQISHTRKLQRLQSEVQMLLYTHPWSEQREAAGAPAVNAFWVHGAGRCDQFPATPHTPEVFEQLRHCALRQDWEAWTVAWQALDAGPLAQLLAHCEAGGQGSLTLTGENTARQWSCQPAGWLTRLRHRLQPVRVNELLCTL